MTGNPISGHTNHNLTVSTATNVDGLGDGDHILSPTLTNIVEGIHGNGIIMYHDTALDASDRNIPANLPGAVDYGSDAQKFTVKGGHVVLDGMMYQFAGGVGTTTTYGLITTDASFAGGAPLSSGEEALVVVFACADNHADVKNIYFMMGDVSTIDTNNYPVCPRGFLNIPARDGVNLVNQQTVVLAVLRVVYSASAGDLELAITEVADKRVFIRPSPIYLSPD